MFEILICLKQNYPLGNPFHVRVFLINGGTKQADTVMAVPRMKVGIEKSGVPWKGGSGASHSCQVPQSFSQDCGKYEL